MTPRVVGTRQENKPISASEMRKFMSEMRTFARESKERDKIAAKERAELKADIKEVKTAITGTPSQIFDLQNKLPV